MVAVELLMWLPITQAQVAAAHLQAAVDLVTGKIEL